MKLGVLEEIMTFDDHRDSDKPNAISATTLLGSMYKAQKYLNKDTKDNTLVDLKFKRSSFIGTAFHARADMITSDKPEYITEQFVEREIEVEGITYTVSGSFDGLKNVDGSWHMYDYKTGYGNKRGEPALEKDAMQMSIYRWLLEPTFVGEIDDLAFSIFVSQSNNVMEEIPVMLKDLDVIEFFIKEKIYAITQNQIPDCNDNVKYNACTYCDYECEHRR